MSDIKIVCDSLSDLKKEMREKYDVEMLPLTVIIDGKEYKDHVTITPSEFYEILDKKDVYPKTSQVTYGQFYECFKKYVDEGKTVLYISASSYATGTYQSALMAKEDVGGDIHVVDSRSLTYGISMLVLRACELREQGKTVEEIVSELEELRKRCFAIFYADTLEYLKKGGRISSTKAVIGSVLNIKPLLCVNEQGTVSQLGQVRGKKHLANKIVEVVRNTCSNDFKGEKVYIGYTSNLEDAKIFGKIVEEDLNAKTEYIEIGPCIGTHGGPGVAGVICFKDKDRI